MEKVSVVIVSWNVAQSLKRCLQSVLATNYPKLEVMVVDNYSTDDSIKVAQSFPQVRLIVNSTNAGFPRAVNQGLRKSDGDYVLILNPDTRISKDFFDSAIQFIKSHPDAGVMGSKLVNPDGTPQGSVFNQPLIFGSNQKYTPTRVEAVFAVSGACMFMPRSTLTKIGYLTEEVFMYYEDLDYCRRLHRAGLKVYFNPDITVIHEHGRSVKEISVEKYRNLIETLIYPMRKLLNIPNRAISNERYRLESGIWYNGWPKQLVITVFNWSGQKLLRRP